MSLYRPKGSRIWHYDFRFKKKRFQGSTSVKNVNQARQIEARIRADLALQGFGIGPQKAAPLFSEFLENDFLEHVYKHAKKPLTAQFYRDKTNCLLKFTKWRGEALTNINGPLIDKYCSWRKASINTINAELRTLGKALRLAAEWGLIAKAPKVRLLPGGTGRDFVVNADVEREYLRVAGYPLAQIAVLMLDCGLRPEECVSLRKSDIGINLFVREGKSVNASRTLPMTKRGNSVLEFLFALFPDSPFVFPGRKDHYRRASADIRHNTLRTKHGWAREFVLHSFRHTYGTRLAESGATPYEIQKLMGHADIRTSMKYVHIQEPALVLASRRKEELDKIRRGEVPEESTNTVRN